MSASLACRGERSRSIAHVIVLLSLAACADPTASASIVERPHVSAAVVAAIPTAVAIGNITGYGVNAAGTIVGPSIGKTSSAYLWDESTGLKSLGSGSGSLSWSISDDGHTIGGKNAAGDPVVWTATTLAGPWTELPIPDAGFGGAVRAIASDATSGAAIVMTGNVWTNGTIKTPARWTPCTGALPDCENGWQLSTVPLTAPITEAWGQDINPSGMIVGMEGTGCCRAAFWDGNAQAILRPIVSGAAAAAWGLNDAGTIIVGQSDGVAVAWVRASTSDDFASVAPIRLETTKTCKGGGTSIAYAVNPDFVTSGTIVGQACGVPVAWKVDLNVPSLVKVVLPSTGRSTSGEARSINRSAPLALHRIVGEVNGAGAYWTNF